MKITPDRWFEEAIAVLRRSSSIKEAAQFLGLKPNIISKRFIGRGLEPARYLSPDRRGRRPNIDELDLQQVKEVLGRCDSVVQAARELGASPNSVSNWFWSRDLKASDYLLRPPLPTDEPLGRLGQRLKGVSSKRGPRGEIIEEWTKTERLTSEEGEQKAEVPPNFVLKKVSVGSDGQGQTRMVWRQFSQERAHESELFWQACREHAAEYAGIVKPTKAPNLQKCRDRLFDVYPIGDLHVGMYAWAEETDQNFDLRIVGEDLMTCMVNLAERSPPSRRAMVVNVGDWYHAQDRKRETPTAGHRLDVDGRHGKVLRAGLDIRRRSIELLLERHDEVVCVDLQGNHDPDLALAVPIVLEEMFRNEPRVKILQNVNPYVYERFGTNLIGMCHGDGPKLAELPMVMAHDRRQDWGETQHHQWICGHRHKDAEEDYPSCLVTTVRTTSANDAWAHWKGYRSSRGMTCFVFDREGGEVDRVKMPLYFARILRESAQ